MAEVVSLRTWNKSCATVFPECTSMPACVRGTYVRAWCRVHWLVPRTEEPSPLIPGTRVSQTLWFGVW